MLSLCYGTHTGNCQTSSHPHHCNISSRFYQHIVAYSQSTHSNSSNVLDSSPLSLHAFCTICHVFHLVFIKPHPPFSYTSFVYISHKEHSSLSNFFLPSMLLSNSSLHLLQIDFDSCSIITS